MLIQWACYQKKKKNTETTTTNTSKVQAQYTAQSHKVNKYQKKDLEFRQSDSKVCDINHHTTFPATGLKLIGEETHLHFEERKSHD